jgi:hypothetical protein
LLILRCFEAFKDGGSLDKFRERDHKSLEISIFTADQLDGLFVACKGDEEERAVALPVYAGIRLFSPDTRPYYQAIAW